MIRGAGGLALAGLWLLLAGLAMTMIVLGRYPVGVALLAVSVALTPTAFRAVKPGKADDAG